MAVEHDRLNTKVKIRVVFDDDGSRGLFSESQKPKKLRRTLIFVNTELHKTVADLKSYIIDVFCLENVCPNDILLSIDGFCLLPNEDTCNLNNEVICVTKETAGGGELLPIDDTKVIRGGGGGYQSEDTDRSEDHLPKKRKASTTLIGSNQEILSKKPRLFNNKKTICPTATETSPAPVAAPQHVEHDIHVKQIKHLEDSPGSDEVTDGPVNKLEGIWAMLDCEHLCLSSEDAELMRSTCNPMGPHYGPMSVLYYLRSFLIFRFICGVEVVGIEELLNKVRVVKQTQTGLEDVDVNNDASKATETSKNDDPVVELAVDEEGANKSMKVDDIKGASSLESILPSSGALKFAEGIVEYCKLLTSEVVDEAYNNEIDIHDLIIGIIDKILTADDLACAHQLFVDKYASLMMEEESDIDEDEFHVRWLRWLGRVMQQI